jgi:hypothetical protein
VAARPIVKTSFSEFRVKFVCILLGEGLYVFMIVFSKSKVTVFLCVGESIELTDDMVPGILVFSETLRLLEVLLDVFLASTPRVLTGSKDFPAKFCRLGLLGILIAVGLLLAETLLLMLR